MIKKLSFLLSIVVVLSCTKEEKNATNKFPQPLTEFSDYYSEPVADKFYSTKVSDTFKIFKSFPKSYHKDSTRKYPIVIILDANAFFEQTVTQLKFDSFIGLVPSAIIIGIGYKDFPTMDSVRTRDYTYPNAIPEYEMSISGGAPQFKKFIDDELIPKLSKEYPIDLERSVLCGHSLGGYFSLYYLLQSAEENKYTIKNIVSASPSLHYNNRYLFDWVKNSKAVIHSSVKLYISMGSGDIADEESKGMLDVFEQQWINKKHPGLKLKKEEYSNFGHIDAALPGFIKGLSYVFEE